MIAYIAFAIAIAADLLTTFRALDRHPTAFESHPVLSKLFGGRPSRKQFIGYAIAQAGAWLAVAHCVAPLEILYIPAAFHLYAAQANYRLEKKQ